MGYPLAALRRFLLLSATALLSIPVLGLLGAATPANANACPLKPLTGTCEQPVDYKVSGTDGTLAVQASPRVDDVIRYVKEGATIGVYCQVNNGGTDPYDHLLSRTWDLTNAGGWVYDHYLTTLAQDANGQSPGIRPCNSSYIPSLKPVNIPHATGRPLATTPTQATSPLNPTTYPWPTQNGWVADGYGYYEGECTSFAAWAVRSDGLHHTRLANWLGDAYMWHAPLDATPHPGDVAQWDGGHNGAGAYGHVGYVAAVYSNGTVKIEEYNWGNFHRLNIRTIPASAPSRYLRF
jgi:surface antigen